MKTKNTNPTEVLILSLQDFENIAHKITCYRGDQEDHNCIDDTIEIKIFSDGTIIIGAEFSSRIEEIIR